MCVCLAGWRPAAAAEALKVCEKWQHIFAFDSRLSLLELRRRVHGLLQADPEVQLLPVDEIQLHRTKRTAGSAFHIGEEMDGNEVPCCLRLLSGLLPTSSPPFPFPPLLSPFLLSSPLLFSSPLLSFPLLLSFPFLLSSPPLLLSPLLLGGKKKASKNETKS